VEAQRLLEELTGVARKVGVDVRVETLRIPMHHTAGGLIRLRGKVVVLLDNKSAVVDRVLTLAEALVPMNAEMAEVVMTDEARNLLDAARARRDGLPPSRERMTLEVKKMSTPQKPGLRACRPKRAR
jgi:hypothetical protein